MRLQVESELEMAAGEIESLTRKIELGAFCYGVSSSH